MVAIKTIVIAGVITVICVTALVVGIVLGTRSYGCSISEAPTEVTVTHSATGTTISWVIPEGEEECEGAYRLRYSIANGPMVQQNFTDLEELSWTIDPLQPCTNLEVHIWPITKDGEVMTEHFMDTFKVPLESLGAPTNIQINEEEGGLEVRWNAPANVGNCGTEIQYEVTVERDGESSTKDASLATSYTIEDSSYCFEVSVSIIAIHEDKSSTAVPGTFQAPPIENIATLQSTEDPTQLVISWNPHPKADLCGIEYRVVYRRGGQEFVVTVGAATLSIELDYCVETELSVAAFNEDHSTEVVSSSGIIYPTEIDAVTDLTIVEGVLSWTAPAVPETCTLTYVLNFDTDAGPGQLHTIETTLSVPEDIYCFTYSVQVVPVLGEQSGRGEIESHTEESGIQDLDVQTSATNPDQLIATWSAHPKEAQCALQYRVSYVVDGTSEFSNDISETTINFDRLYCTEAIVSVIATNGGAANSQPTTRSVEVEDPTEVGSVSNVEIVDGVVTWTPRSALRRCSVKYVLNVDGDNGQQQYNTADSFYSIPSTAYCFSFAVGVSAVIGEDSGVPIFESYTEGSPVQNLQVETSSANSDQLTATWDIHPKETQCSLRYEITYTIDGTPETWRESANTATFDKAYCVEGVLSVTAINNNGARSDPTPYVVEEQDPTEIGSVSNIEIVDGVVTWTPISALGSCSVSYVLNVDGDNGQQQYITLDSFYSIPSTAYCFRFAVGVSAVIGENSGASTFESHTEGSPVQNLQVETSSANSDQLTATWDIHPKETQCSLRYEITYTIDGTPETWTESANTATFDKAYCVEGVLSVTAINDNGARNDPTPYVVEEQDPTEIGSVSNIEIVDGVVTWTPISALSSCTVSYVLNVDGDNGQQQYITLVSFYSIPSTAYCFRFAVGVSAVIGENSGAPIFESHTEGSPVQNLQVETSSANSDQLTATWDIHPKETQCSLRYEITYTVDGTPETWTESANTATFDKAYCVEGVLSVTAINDNGARSDPTPYVVEEQDPTEIESVSNMEIVDGVVTWTPISALSSCSVSYVLNVDGDNGQQQYTTINSFYSIPSTAYCFRFAVGVSAVIGENSGAPIFESHTEGSPVQNLQVETSTANSGQLTATWDIHPKETQCSLRYEITYTVDGTPETWTESANTATFDRAYCVEGVFSVAAINDNGARSDPTSYVVEEQDPTEIGSVSNIEIVDGVVTWTPISALSSCSVSYVLNVDGDNGQQQYTTLDSFYSIPSTAYCFRFAVGVSAVIGENSGAPIFESHTEGSPVQNLQVETSSANSDQLTATWDIHPKETQCSLRYEITYIVDGTPETWTESANTATFDRAYCLEGVFSVTAINDNGARSDPTSYVVEEQDPTEIGSVSDIEIVDGVVIWTPISAPSSCSVSYVLNVDGDNGQQQYTTIDSFYSIPSTAYCFRFAVGVSASIGENSGAPIFESHTEGSPVQNLQVETSSVNSDQLTATWDIHPKETQCSLRYEITYTIDGTPETWTASANTATFDKAYCVEGVFSVTAINDNGVRSDPTPYVVEEQDPTEIGSVSNIEIVDGVVTWTPISELSSCSVSYVLNVDGDNGQQQYTTLDSFYSIPSTAYCFRFAVGVSAVIGENSGAPIFESHTEGSPVQNLQVETSSANSDQLTATWDIHPKETQCSLRYEITYTIGGTPETWTESGNTATFDKAYCVEGVFSVTAINDNGARSDPTPYVVEEQDPTEIGSVSDIEIVDGVVIWTPISAPSSCSVSYVLNVDGDNGQQQYITLDSFYSIPSTAYCFSFAVGVSAVIGVNSGASFFESYTEGSPVQNLQVETSSANSDQLTATWDIHPKETQCSLRYEITYTIDGTPETWTESANTATFDKVYCVEGVLSVTAINDNGARNDPTPYVVEEQYPTEIGSVSNIEIVDGVVTWTPISALRSCSVSYVLNVDGDNGQQQYTTLDSFYSIPSTAYCFSFAVGISAVVGLSMGESAFHSFTDALEVGTVTAVPILAENEVTVSWPVHSKRDQCGITYDVTYSYGSMENQAPIRSDQETAVFSLGYCVVGTVTVTAVASVVTATASNIGTHPSLTPTVIGQVQDLTAVSIPDNEITVSWNPPLYVSQCGNIEYEVTATNRATPTDTDLCNPTTDSTSCVVTEYCPTTDIRVIATYTDTIDIIGEIATHEYTCDTSSGAQD